MNLCRNCNTNAPINEKNLRGEFCSEQCLTVYYNNLRLFFPSDLAPEVEDRESIILHSKIGLNKLIQNRTSEENMLLCEILTEAVIHLNTILIPQRAQKELKEKIAADVKRKSEQAAKTVVRDSQLVESAELTREKQEIIKSGEKLSKSGNCHYCGKPSTGMFCKGTNHKLKYEVVVNYAKRMNVSLERARKLVDAMEKAEEQ